MIMALLKDGRPWRPAAGSGEEAEGWVWDEQTGKEHLVSMRFVSGTAGHDLPKEVASLRTKVLLDLSNMLEVSPQPSFEDVKEGGGTWRFAGWQPESRLVVQQGLEFVGTWLWEADKVLGPLEVEPVAFEGFPRPRSRGPKHASPASFGTQAFFAAGYVSASAAAATAVLAAALAAAAAWAVGRKG